MCVQSCNYTSAPPQTANTASTFQCAAHLLKPCLAKYPSLEDILDNAAAYPYNLTSFIGFLSQNHCLETVEFTMDVAKYSGAYEAKSYPAPVLTMMWNRIVDTYVRAGGPKELNLPGEVKANLVSVEVKEHAPPPPHHFAVATVLVKEMMKDNAYMAFISSVKRAGHAPSGAPRNVPETCLHSLSTYGSVDSGAESAKSDCSWHHPDSWHSDGNLSKSSSAESLYMGEDAFNRHLGNPMTPPESPLCFSSDPTSRLPSNGANMGIMGQQHHTQGQQQAQHSPSSPTSSEASSTIPRHHSHWRKMSQRLKWRRSSDKDLHHSS